jgi:hypothetical protein
VLFGATKVDEVATIQDLGELFQAFTRTLAGEAKLPDNIVQTPRPTSLPGFDDSQTEAHVTPQKVLDALRVFNQKPRPIRVCFVLCHGTSSGLQLDEDVLNASDLTDAFYPADPTPHLAVLIVDACQSGFLLKGGLSERPRRSGSVWKSLYFGHHGKVVLTSTSGNQNALISKSGKSVFFSSFVTLFDELFYPRPVFGVPEGQLITWKEFFHVLECEYRVQYEEAMAEWFKTDSSVMDFAAARPVVTALEKNGATKFDTNRDEWIDRYNKWLKAAERWQNQCSGGEGLPGETPKARELRAKNQMARKLIGKTVNSYAELRESDDEEKILRSVIDLRVASPPTALMNDQSQPNDIRISRGEPQISSQQ